MKRSRIEIQNDIADLIDEAVSVLNEDEMILFIDVVEKMIKDISDN